MVLDFNINITEEKKAHTVRVAGDIDIYTSPKLKNFLKNLLGEGPKNVVLNLENVKYIDSTGLGTIVFLSKELYKKERGFSIVSQSLQLKKIFEVAGLTKKNILIFEEESLALASL
jgi:anti-sigma B factor antagonist